MTRSRESGILNPQQSDEATRNDNGRCGKRHRPERSNMVAPWRPKIFSLAPNFIHAEAFPQATSAFIRRALPPQVSPRRALAAKFYVGSMEEPIEAELPVWVTSDLHDRRPSFALWSVSRLTGNVPERPLLAISRSACRLDLGPLNLQLQTFGRGTSASEGTADVPW